MELAKLREEFPQRVPLACYPVPELGEVFDTLSDPATQLLEDTFQEVRSLSRDKTFDIVKNKWAPLLASAVYLGRNADGKTHYGGSCSDRMHWGGRTSPNWAPSDP